ncbi:MoxR family ATPase [Streptomyces physcomitrii]|uniref:AAA family ATPase n=1 Tax=Streptomyces physcomitrii TaxID=2724184 RepID=UPI003437BDFF
MTEQGQVAAGFFGSVDEVAARLAEVGYLASPAVATTVYLADRLGKPLLVEGPAGVGKTELAKAVGRVGAAPLTRLQCYEGIDESRALYEWNHAKQLLRITAGRETTGAEDPAGGSAGGWDATRDDIFSEEFLLARPLLTAIRRTEPSVLLIDEIDKADVEVEALLLEVLSDFQITVPELGTVEATHRPFVVLTSNASRELSEALRRRCLFLHLDYPDTELELRIVRLQVPGLDEVLADSVVRTVAALRALGLRKAPSVAETVDWARTLLALGADTLDERAVRESLGVVLKHQDDVVKATEKLITEATVATGNARTVVRRPAAD